ncbi:hypothetical protein ABVB70_19610 [Agrobacterium radiobacter]|uniref:Uncharacterized protein n=1 Tax=Agrobacterium radiobacter TaxID=362 RepID=A0ABD5LPE3_AGRRD
MTLKIKCPSCHLMGLICEDDSVAVNDNKDMVKWIPPAGFRKVQLGWNNAKVNLLCVSCGVAAELAD